jgi:penicillin-binding protein 1A
VSRLRFLSGPSPSRDRRRNPLWRFRRALLLLGMLAFGGLLGGVLVLSRIELDVDQDDFGELAQTSYICTAEVAADCGPDVATARLSAGEDREVVPYERIPDVVIWAVVATEDKDFFGHHGIDPVGIGRAAYQGLRSSGASQGGSTITQQYVKNTFTGSDRTLVRKLREATLAVKLEREWSKEEILGRYLNRIYFGRGSYGIQAAAQSYFGKNVDELDLADAAFLAGLIRSPGRADPADDPDEATRRRQTTLVRMVEDGYVTQAEADEAAVRDWSGVAQAANREGLGTVLGAAFGTEYFVEAVRQELARMFPDGGLYTEGLRVYTTLDPELQSAAFATVADVVDPRTSADDPSGSLVAVDRKGQVVAMMGGYDFQQSQVNLALGRAGGGSGRQPGSSFKPFALAEALEQGYSPYSFFSAPSTITLPNANNGADWVVSGGGSQEGYRDLVDALRVSSNVVYAQLMVQLKPEKVVQLAQRLGVSAELPAVNSLVLGSGEVSVLDMAAAYSTIANQGVRYEPILIERIEFADGRPTCWYPVGGVCTRTEGRSPTDPDALDAKFAQVVTYAMSQVVEAGTGRAAGEDLAWPAAGKTGTTQDNRDAWFVGFSCDITAAVWMGYVGAPGEPVRTMSDFGGTEVQGGGFPAEMWGEFMRRASESAWASQNPPCEQLATLTDLDGVVLNPELSTTTLPPCVVPLGGPTTPEDSTTGPTTPEDSTTGPTTPEDSTTGPTTPEDSTTGPAAPSTTTPSTTVPPTAPPTTEPCQQPDPPPAGEDEGGADGEPSESRPSPPASR